MAYGTCKLTNQTGKLVKSHLLPKAVTLPPDPSVPRLDGYNGGRPARRFDSWYDSNIVTRHGEDILSFYDDWAIKELRRLNIIWDGRKQGEDLVQGEQYQERGEGIIREVDCSDPARLRLFFLSLLWRAASTSLPGYRVDIPEQNVERLRQMIVNKSASPLTFYPVVLTQLTTVGPWHNAGPRRMILPDSDISTEGVNFIRFYFDGLVAHLYENETEEFLSTLGNFAIGASQRISLFGLKFEESSQEEWLRDLILYHYDNHLERSQKILGLVHK